MKDSFTSTPFPSFDRQSFLSLRNKRGQDEAVKVTLSPNQEKKEQKVLMIFQADFLIGFLSMKKSLLLTQRAVSPVLSQALIFLSLSWEASPLILDMRVEYTYTLQDRHNGFYFMRWTIITW